MTAALSPIWAGRGATAALRAGMYAGWIAAPTPGVRVSQFALALSAGP